MSVTLIGKAVHLEPLHLDHVAGLSRVGLHPDLWLWIPTPVNDEEGMHGYVATALEEQRAGKSLPFAIIHSASGQVIGSTRFANIDVPNCRLEIGWSWITGLHQRTVANTETKLLLLTHAFDALGANRVEFKTDLLNEKSRNALARLGAVQEGIFRKHIVTASGRVRDTVYYSIIDTEWPAIEHRLRARCSRPI